MPRYFTELGQELFHMHRLLLEAPTLVTFSNEQWERHTDFFSRYLSKVLVEGNEATVGILFRHGLLTMRLAAILTVFRKWDDFRHAKEYRCSDTDFTTALDIVRVLLEHSLLLSTSLPATSRPPKAMKKFHSLDVVIEKLSRKFSFTEFIQSAINCGYSESTGKRLLKKAIEQKLVGKQKDRYCKKRKLTSKEGQ